MDVDDGTALAPNYLRYLYDLAEAPADVALGKCTVPEGTFLMDRRGGQQNYDALDSASAPSLRITGDFELFRLAMSCGP